MKKILVMFICCLTLFGGIAVAATPTPTPDRIIINTGSPGYTETGTWQATQLAGYNGGVVRSSATLGSTATWTVTIPVTGYYTVTLAFPKGAGADLACYTLNNKPFYVKQKTFTSDYDSLGNYSYAANTQVTVTLTVKSNGLHLADAVILTRTPAKITPTPTCPCIWTTDTKVEAEGCPSSGITNAGTYITSCDDGDWVYLGTMIYAGESIVEVNAAIPSQSAGRSIEIRADSPYGTLLGALNFVSTGGVAPNFYPQLTWLSNYSGASSVNVPIYAIFRNGPNIGDVDYIRIFSVLSYRSEYRPVVSPTPPPNVTPTPTATPTPTIRPNTPTPTRRVTPTLRRRVTPTRRITPTPTVNRPTPTLVPDGYVVSYAIQSDWGNGATVNVTIQNTSSTTILNWTLAWAFSGNQMITNLWNGSFTQSGASVSVKNADSNAMIAAGGGSVNFGFNLSYSGTNAKPTSFTLNGVPCLVK